MLDHGLLSTKLEVKGDTWLVQLVEGVTHDPEIRGIPVPCWVQILLKNKTKTIKKNWKVGVLIRVFVNQIQNTNPTMYLDVNV